MARLAGGPTAQIVDTDDVTSRLIVQSSRQSGVSVVCMDLLDFDGDEIYMRSDEALAGMRYGEALLAYSSGVLIGLRRAGGQVMLNPPMDTVIEPGDETLLIAADDTLVRLAQPWVMRPSRSTCVASRQSRPAPDIASMP